MVRENPEDGPMMNSRTHRRRAWARHVKDENGASSSVLEILMNYLTDRVARSAILHVKQGVHEVVRWTVLRVIMGWIGAAIMTGGILLLLVAGVKGLEALHCPLWLACLSTGIFAILIVLVAMRGILWPNEDEEND
jgi:hypothetical protein